MGRWPNVGLLLGQRRRRRANSKPKLGQRLMFAGKPLFHFYYATKNRPIKFLFHVFIRKKK